MCYVFALIALSVVGSNEATTTHVRIIFMAFEHFYYTYATMGQVNVCSQGYRSANTASMFKKAIEKWMRLKSQQILDGLPFSLELFGSPQDEL